MTKILDCTIRDGGHANNWQFSDECILASLKAAELSGVDYFEAGYHMPDCISSSKIKLVLMVNASDLCCDKPFIFGSESQISHHEMQIQHDDYQICHPEHQINHPENQINHSEHQINHPELVSGSQIKKIDCIRIACYPHEILTGMKACEELKKQGYEVFLHLMTADKIENFSLLKDWQNKEILTSIYFADTFGSFMPETVERIYNDLKNCGYRNISFHAHNNIQLAFANTIKAIELGAYSVDASTYGMGRGAGNLPIELLLHYFGKDNSNYLRIIQKYYVELQQKCRWGYDFKNVIGGINNIHPREIDNFLTQIIE